LPKEPPGPIIKFTVPAGKPTLSKISNILIVDNTVSELGLKIMQLPAANAGANFQTPIRKGKFQGVINAHTPTGSVTLYECILPKLELTSYTPPVGVLISPA